MKPQIPTNTLITQQNNLQRIHYQRARKSHWDQIARQPDTWNNWGDYYHQRLAQIYQFLVPPGRRVLEVGCGRGDLLATLQPALGVGVDLSAEMVRRAVQHHPHLYFLQADAQELNLNQKFDVIILSDLVNDLWDVQAVLEQLQPLTTPKSKLILNFYSHLWEFPLKIAEKSGLARPNLDQNWLTVEDIENLLRLTHFEVIKTWQEFLWPFQTPGLSAFFNRFLVRVWPFNHLALTNLVLAKPQMHYSSRDSDPSVSVIVPARNEAGNISQIFERVPEMGRNMELIFVEGHSEDNTYAAIEQEIAAHSERDSRLYRQTGRGKGDAVRLGFQQAKGDILMILDADLTVPPEDLPRFYNALRCGHGEFINGVRLVYPMEQQAMRFANLVGNKFFGLAFSWLLGQPIRDTLCGTKVLWRTDYELIVKNRDYFGDFDPFGDFDLIFGATKLGLKIVDLPIRYRQRTYGSTNIQRWKHGWLLLRMTLFAANRMKFV